jgi:hypothetical protein
MKDPRHPGGEHDRAEDDQREAEEQFEPGACASVVPFEGFPGFFQI